MFDTPFPTVFETPNHGLQKKKIQNKARQDLKGGSYQTFGGDQWISLREKNRHRPGSGTLRLFDNACPSEANRAPQRTKWVTEWGETWGDLYGILIGKPTMLVRT